MADDDELERGAHLKLAQRHRVVVPGTLHGPRVWQAELHSPGTLGAASVTFSTSGNLPKESKLVFVFPDTGWGFPDVPLVVVAASAGRPSPRAKAVWHRATHTLDVTTLDEDIEAGAMITLTVAGVATPACATPSGELVATTFEKKVARNTVPPSTRGGHVIDGPTRMTIPSLVPGLIAGERRWMPLNCCPNAVADVSLDLKVTGSIPAGGKILVELAHDGGWDMDATPKISLDVRPPTSLHVLGPVAVTATWHKDQQALEMRLLDGLIPMQSTIKLLVHQVHNPVGERPEAIARVTTLVSNGGVIDGPVKVTMARISELRELDFAKASEAFARHDPKDGLLTLETVVAALKELSIRTSVDALRTSGLQCTPIEEPNPAAAAPPVHKKGEVAPVIPPTITRDGVSHEAFLNYFTTVYTPAFKFGEELRTVAGRGLLPRLRELALNGCDVNAKDGAGWTALHYAAEHGALKAIHALVDAAPALHVDAVDVAGWTPLMCAAANGHITVISRLLELGANVNHKSKEGRTALHWAASRGMEGAVSFLLLGGAEIDAIDRSKWTALHCAAVHGNVGCGKLLLEYGADLATTDALGRSGWTYWDAPAAALLQGHIEKLQAMGMLAKKS
ncbi:hypothetical protein SDRG_05121 [Saprolegnia diclina VS20]|uniref:Uncharacterized protein n=1 Tax=Saprolegnia diclina (strain VS20) TaxID=1156394 RepID=T0RYA0_SAPDV|nr:hypothetical protein SDRG_05121 [Saprolegnia diclina VS20]EQC37518.1 hypothetical protein SDRG_05121 [Saprolegnia diclina VS20]|eukprot:XP_008609038.1 hypothetical protein SDRG_05121 [Saprolegnia diclina VS20]